MDKLELIENINTMNERIDKSNSIATIICGLNFMGIFPKKEIHRNIKSIIFSEDNQGTTSYESYYKNRIKDLKKDLRARKLLTKDYQTPENQKLLKQALKHVILWNMLNEDYFGIRTIHELLEIIVEDPDFKSFIGEYHGYQTPAFSFTNKTKQIIGYTNRIRKHLSEEEKNKVIEEIKILISPAVIKIDNHVNKSSNIDLFESFERMVKNITKKDNYHDNYRGVYVSQPKA